jgi:hypothetical protein
MKTTIDIADALMAKARRAAQREQTTLRALVEEGLRRVLAEREQQTRYVLPDVSFGGEGLVPDLREGDWEAIRARAYEGRGE